MSAEGCGTQKSDNLSSTPRTNIRPEPRAGSPRSLRLLWKSPARHCLLGGKTRVPASWRLRTGGVTSRQGLSPTSVASSLCAAEKSCRPALCCDLDPAGLRTATQRRPGETEGLGEGHRDSQSTSLPGMSTTQGCWDGEDLRLRSLRTTFLGEQGKQDSPQQSGQSVWSECC